MQRLNHFFLKKNLYLLNYLILIYHYNPVNKILKFNPKQQRNDKNVNNLTEHVYKPFTTFIYLNINKTKLIYPHLSTTKKVKHKNINFL